ncbi:uncharacterized protein [Prorops nasuta]|uniref:uncharacterized protein n=1 Tax=Prorops nasuta TaxID=863751 RepID=UPI0034CDD0EC
MSRIPFTIQEKELICDLVDRFKDILLNKATDGSSIKKKDEAWKNICAMFNNNEYSTRTPQQIKKCWENLIQRKRKQNTAQKAHRLKTGGGSPFREIEDPLLNKVNELSKFNDIELRSFDSNTIYEDDNNIAPSTSEGIYYISDSDDYIDRYFKRKKPSNSKQVGDNKVLQSKENTYNQLDKNEDDKDVLNLLKEYAVNKSKNDCEKNLRLRKIAEAIVQQRELHKIKLETAKAENQIAILKLLQMEDDLENRCKENNA